MKIKYETEVSITFLQLYFAMTLYKFIEPTKLLSKYLIGFATLSPTALSPAKWITASNLTTRIQEHYFKCHKSSIFPNIIIIKRSKIQEFWTCYFASEVEFLQNNRTSA